MDELLIIDAEFLSDVFKIIKKLNKTHADCYVSFIIEPKNNTLLLIGGHYPEYRQITMALPEDHNLQKRQFTLDGEYFSQLPSYSGKNNSIKLDLNNTENTLTSVGITTDKNEYLSCYIAPFFQGHKEFIKEEKKYIYEEVRCARMSRLILEGNTYSPYQFISFDKEKKEILVQNDDNQERYDIPNYIEIPFSLVLTQEVADNLKELCDKTGNTSMEIYQHGENITLKTNDTTVTLSQMGLEEFYNNKPKDYDQLGYMIIDIDHLIKRVNHFKDKYQKIKKANKSHLLIEPTQLYLISLVTPYQFDVPIASDAISFSESQLYVFHIDNIPIKIKDITSSDKLKIAILREKDQEGKYKLCFYKDISNKYPYVSIPIGPAPNDMNVAQAVISNAKKDKQREATDEPIEDMFGFEYDE